MGRMIKDSQSLGHESSRRLTKMRISLTLLQTDVTRVTGRDHPNGPIRELDEMLLLFTWMMAKYREYQ